jgi:lipopolysaccharide biosynthesis glycosyltransferase
MKNNKPKYIWGAGECGNLTALNLLDDGFEVKGFIDKNAKEIKTKLYLPVLMPQDGIIEIKNGNSAQIIIAIHNESSIKEIVNRLLSAGLKEIIDFDVSPLISMPLKYYTTEKLTSQNESIEIIKNRRDIYLHDEKTAKKLAADWDGILSPLPLKLSTKKNAIPIVMASNENYAPYLAVMLQSLLDNSNSNRFYHFIILERGFTKKTKDYLSVQVSKFAHCEIDIIDSLPLFDGIPFVSPGQYFSIDMYLRLLIPYYLDKYPKVIYCDCDMIAKADIGKLYDLDIEPYCIGAAICPVTNYHLKQKKYDFICKTSPVFMLLENWHRYINSGVLVFNTMKFKNKFSYKDLFRFAIYFTNRYTKHYGDQDILALCIKDYYFVLPPEWNHLFYSSPTQKSPAPPANTKIIHYTGNVKPWQDIPEINDNPDVQYYRKFAASVPLYRTSLHTDFKEA